MKKLMKIFVLTMSLLFVFSAISIVSAHPGHGTEPVVEDLNPKDNSQVSGNVKISPKIHQTYDISYVDFNITGSNSYKKNYRDSNPSDGWSYTWDTSNVANGKYKIKITVTDVLGKTGSKEFQLNVKNTKKSTNINLAETHGVINQKINIVAKLKDEKNNLLSNKNLIFSINGKDFVIKTDAGGIAKYSYNPSTNGTFELIVKFLGDEIYLPSQTNSNVQIKTNGIYLKVNSISSDKGKNVQLKASLSSNNGYDVSNKEVTFYINGKAIGTVRTGTNGVATLNYNVPLTGGNYTIEAIHNYNENNVIIYNSETLKVYQSSFYTSTSANKANPKVGDTFTITHKLTNLGPDAGKNTILTYKVPRGLEFIKASVSTGKYTYNSKTRTLTWNIPSAKVGLSTLKVIMKVSGVSRYVVTPTTLNSETYAPSINNAIVQKKITTVKSKVDLVITKIKRVGNKYKVTIKNNGKEKSQKTKLRILYKQGKKNNYKIISIKGIKAKKSLTISINFFKYSKHRKYTKIAQINYDKSAGEYNYKNNAKKFKT